MTGKIIGLAHIGVRTADIEKSIEFYQALGFELTNRADVGTKLAFLDCGACEVELIQAAQFNKDEGPVAHIALNVQNIEEYAADKKAKGLIPADAEIKCMDILGGVKNLFFKGPSNETLELFDYYNTY